MEKESKNYINVLVLASIGYFVDIYDILIFSVVRTESLADIGIAKANNLNVGLELLNYQVFGLVIGGFIWGILADKKGRVRVLLFSILIYSIFTLLNGMATNLFHYKLCRFGAGIGLSGELGAGVAVITELLKKERRWIGATLISSIGMCGAFAAAIAGNFLHWRSTYFLGGIVGILILFMRIKMVESEIYINAKTQNKKYMGSLKLIFTNYSMFLKYLMCIFIGSPIYFFIGIMMTTFPEIVKFYGIEPQEKVNVVSAIMVVSYISIIVSDIVCGYLSKVLKSRKKPMLISIILFLFGLISLIIIDHRNLFTLYLSFFIMGSGIGYWGNILANAAEQFGTNLRGTVSTSVPNLIRGLLIPISILFSFFRLYFNLEISFAFTGTICILFSLFSLIYLKDTYEKDLNYIEKM